MTDTTLTLAGLILQQTALIGGMSWVAWHFERRVGADAFHLLLPLATGTMTVLTLAGLRVPLIPAVLTGATTAAIVDISFARAIRRLPPEALLLASVVVAAITATSFDHITGHQTVSLDQSNFIGLSTCAIATVLALAVAGTIREDPYLNELRLGVSGRVVVAGWRQLRTRPTAYFVVSYAIAWFAVVLLPLTTTGVTSYRLLRDIIIALLIVRLVGPRRPWYLLAVAVFIALIRVYVAYKNTGTWAGVAVEAVLVIGAIVVGRLNALSRGWSEIRV